MMDIVDLAQIHPLLSSYERIVKQILSHSEEIGLALEAKCALLLCQRNEACATITRGPVHLEA